MSHNVVSNSSEGALPCHANHSETAADESLDLVTKTGAVRSEPLDCVRLRFYCSAAVITMLCLPQPVRNQLARLCGSTFSLGTCCVELERLPSCHWVSLIWMTSPEKRTLHSIWVGLFILPIVYMWSCFSCLMFFTCISFGMFNYFICRKKAFFFLFVVCLYLFVYLPACIHTVGILGPMFGFMLGSFLTKIYVDIGSVDLGRE